MPGACKAPKMVYNNHFTSAAQNVLFIAPGGKFSYGKHPISGPMTCSTAKNYYHNYCNGNQEFKKYKLSTNAPNATWQHIWNGNTSTINK